MPVVFLWLNACACIAIKQTGGIVKYRTEKKWRLKEVCLSFVLTSLLISRGICVGEEITLPAIEVEGQKEGEFVIQPAWSTIGTKERVDRATIDIQGGAEQISPYKAIALQPGVDISSKDAFGMEISHRIRGKSNRNIGEVLEGLPLKGIGPGVGLSTMVDLENIEAISLTKGAVSADSGFGYGNDSGVLDMHIRRPLDYAHVTLKQGFGSEDFMRSYTRLDTGSLGGMARAFVSASYTDADKWKGKGQSPDARKNFAFGLLSAGQPFDLEVYGIYNEDNRHYYRGLSYEQTKDLSEYKDFDYNTSLTGDSSQDMYYYDYNKQNFETYTIFGKLDIPLGRALKFTFRPYYLRDRGHRYFGSKNKVIDWLVDHDTYGTVFELSHGIGQGEIKLGYWYQQDEPPGPPTARKYFSTGGKFLSWERLVKGSNHKFKSPYITAEKTFGRATVNAGVKYLWMTSPDWTSYDTTGLDDVSYSEALSRVGEDDILIDVEGKTYELFLPNVGASYDFAPNLTVRASYGRNYETPQYGLGSAIIQYYKKGLTDEELQEVWHSIKPETSHNFDLGLTYTHGSWFIAPTLYYSLIKNVALNCYDPELAFSYWQNVGEAHSYGAEMAVGYSFNRHFNTSVSLSYNNYEFTEDVQSSGGTTIHSKGHQIPNVPVFMANWTATLDIKGFRLTPTVRYLGKRYADVENEYSVKSHVVVDLALTKRFKLTEKRALTLAASITNLLDEDYISIISAGDTSIGRDAPTYYPGAPRTFFASVQLDF
jgi:iron complex outermembrane receptor protein